MGVLLQEVKSFSPCCNNRDEHGQQGRPQADSDENRFKQDPTSPNCSNRALCRNNNLDACCEEGGDFDAMYNDAENDKLKTRPRPLIEERDQIIPAENSLLFNDPFHYDWPFW